jgi:phosphopantetheine adenylyltransferase
MREAERLNHELLAHIDANEALKKQASTQVEEFKKRIREIDNENKSLKAKNLILSS